MPICPRDPLFPRLFLGLIGPLLLTVAPPVEAAAENSVKPAPLPEIFEATNVGSADRPAYKIDDVHRVMIQPGGVLITLNRKTATGAYAARTGPILLDSERPQMTPMRTTANVRAHFADGSWVGVIRGGLERPARNQDTWQALFDARGTQLKVLELDQTTDCLGVGQRKMLCLADSVSPSMKPVMRLIDLDNVAEVRDVNLPASNRGLGASPSKRFVHVSSVPAPGVYDVKGDRFRTLRELRPGDYGSPSAWLQDDVLLTWDFGKKQNAPTPTLVAFDLANSKVLWATTLPRAEPLALLAGEVWMRGSPLVVLDAQTGEPRASTLRGDVCAPAAHEARGVAYCEQKGGSFRVRLASPKRAEENAEETRVLWEQSGKPRQPFLNFTPDGNWLLIENAGDLLVIPVNP